MIPPIGRRGKPLRVGAAGNMPQVPGFAILIADARAPQVLSVGPVIDQITHRSTIEDEHSKLG